MNIKIHLHPNYWMFQGFVETIPQGKYKREKTYCNQRNTVEWVKWGGMDMIIKRYKRPTWINCLIYTWIRKTKARRAYEHAEELLKRGFDTAFPVAYIEIRKWGIFHTGYFVSRRLPYPLIKDIPLMEISEAEKEIISTDFIRYTARLHQEGIFPKDYNAGNIFFHKEGEHYRFALIDINRLQFGRSPNEKESARFFEQMGVSISQAIECIGQYSTLRGFNTDRYIFFILLHRWRKRVQQFFKKKMLHP